MGKGEREKKGKGKGKRDKGKGEKGKLGKGETGKGDKGLGVVGWLATGSHELSCRAVRWAQRRRGSTVGTVQCRRKKWR